MYLKHFICNDEHKYISSKLQKGRLLYIWTGKCHVYEQIVEPATFHLACDGYICNTVYSFMS